MDENVKKRLDDQERRLAELERRSDADAEPPNCQVADALRVRLDALEAKVTDLDPLFSEARAAFERVADKLDAPAAPAEETYATYTPTGPLDVEAGAGFAKSLSKAVMSAGGSNHFDLAVVRVPCHATGVRLGLDEVLAADGTSVLEVFEEYDAVNGGDPRRGECLYGVDVAGARLLAAMLTYWANEREARAKEGT